MLIFNKRESKKVKYFDEESFKNQLSGEDNEHILGNISSQVASDSFFK